MLYEVITEASASRSVSVGRGEGAQPASSTWGVITSYSIHYTKLYDLLFADDDRRADVIDRLVQRRSLEALLLSLKGLPARTPVEDRFSYNFV